MGRDVARLALRAPTLGRLPRGDGGPVVCVTGFGAGDLSLSPLRALLRRLGHDAVASGLGRVDDDVDGQTEAVAGRVADLAESAGRPVALVGWSIGGVVCREVARERPDVVRRVVTFGTPVEGGPSYTALAFRYPESYLAEIRAEIEARRSRPIQVPVTAIWSPNDGIVTPEACLDHDTLDVENVRVSSTHVGMGIDPDVWRIVADRLARPT